MSREAPSTSARPAAVNAEDAVRRYDDLKLGIAKIGQTAMQLCRELGDQQRATQHQTLLARLAEDRFNLAVLGQFSRGKSTLMNAVMGMDRLPTGVLPHTSVVTTVCFGEKERILVRIEGWPLPQEIRRDELADYVTESGNPGNRRRVVSAEIQLPVEMLRRGLAFIDTPGVGSTIAENTLTTLRYLPEVDAAIFVTGFDSALGDSELEFLRAAVQTIGKVIVVVNKLDLVSAGERDKVLSYVGDRLADEIGDRPEIFAVSARDALRGKLASDQSLVDGSGIAALERAIFCFLETEKVPQLCKRILERLRGLLGIQQAEFAAASATDNSTAALSRIEKTVEEFQARRKEFAGNSVAELRQSLGRHLDPLLNEVFAELQASVIGQFGEKLIREEKAFRPPRFREVMDEASSFCASRLVAWLAGSTSTLEQVIRESAGAPLKDLVEMPSIAWTQLVEPGGRAVTADTEDGVHATLNLPRVAKLEWTGRLPWTIHLVPIQWATSAIQGWFGEATLQLLAEYREGLFRALLEAAEDLLHEIELDVESRITDCAARMTRVLKGGPSLSAGKERLQELLSQLGAVRQLLANSDEPGLALGESKRALSSTAFEGTLPTRASAWSICPVCVSVTRAVFEYLAQRQYDLGADGRAQARHAQAGGFCPFHTWLYESLASPQSICRAYPDLLIARVVQLKEAAARSVSTSELRRVVSRAVADPARCTACDVARRKERDSARAVIASTSAPGPSDAPVLCVPHLQVALAYAADLQTAQRLVAATANALEVVADAMTRFSLKFDAVRRGLVTSTEREAYAAGLSKLVGVRRLGPSSSSNDTG